MSLKLPHVVALLLVAVAELVQVSSAYAAPAVASNAKSNNREERAPSAADIASARKRFFRAVQYYESGDYKLALIEFRRTYELSRNFRILYNIGQVHQQLNNYSRAIASLEQYLHEGKTDVPEERRTEIARDLAELRKKVAQVEIVLNVDSADLLIDQVPVGKISRRRSVTLDAGDHLVEVRREGYRNANRMMTLAGGDSISLELNLKKSPALATAYVREPSRVPALAWAGWVATGVFAIGAGVTGAVAASHASTLSDLRESPDSTAREREAEQNKARAFALTSDALTIAAVVTGATSLYFTVRRDSGERRRERANTTRVALGVGGLSVSRSF
jgi:tetratricopeptide (TPR) repeat protein